MNGSRNRFLLGFIMGLAIGFAAGALASKGCPPVPVPAGNPQAQVPGVQGEQEQGVASEKVGGR